MNREAARLARELRREDLVVELGDESFRLKKSFEAAAKLGARFVLIVGENEVKAGDVRLEESGDGRAGVGAARRVGGAVEGRLALTNLSAVVEIGRCDADPHGTRGPSTAFGCRLTSLRMTLL